MQQLRQRVIATYHLGPMDALETQAYIEHRLLTVGWKGDPSFTPARTRPFTNSREAYRARPTTCATGCC
jgi:hypothetical protein